MNVIQYGAEYGIFTDEGDQVEIGFASRWEANEALDRITADAPESMTVDEITERIDPKPKRARKVK
jgi:hypothetical protein